MVLLAIVAFSSFRAYYAPLLTIEPKRPALSPSFGPGYSAPNSIGENVSVIGYLATTNVKPACGLSSNQCAAANTPIYYLTIGGLDYRLIFSNSTQPPMIFRTRVLVSGVFVTPSTFDSTQWTPSLIFNGDIYVESLIYLRDFP